MPSIAAHEGNLVRAVCHPAIWSRAYGRSISEQRALCKARERTLSLRCLLMNSSVVMSANLMIFRDMGKYLSVFLFHVYLHHLLAYLDQIDAWSAKGVVGHTIGKRSSALRDDTKGGTILEAEQAPL